MLSYDSNVESPSGLSFVWKMRADGSRKTRVVYAPETGEIRQPSWSPDGEDIVHYRYGRYEGSTASEIFTMDSSGGEATRLTFNGVRDKNPRFSPDGGRITFDSNSQVWVMDADGSDKEQLTTRPDGSVE